LTAGFQLDPHAIWQPIIILWPKAKKTLPDLVDLNFITWPYNMQLILRLN